VNVPLPTVSRKVADLDGQLNIRLLVRPTRSLRRQARGTSKTLDDLAKHMGVTYIAFASGMIGIFDSIRKAEPSGPPSVPIEDQLPPKRR
jgi:hypothetical protein